MTTERIDNTTDRSQEAQDDPAVLRVHGFLAEFQRQITAQSASFRDRSSTRDNIPA